MSLFAPSKFDVFLTAIGIEYSSTILLFLPVSVRKPRPAEVWESAPAVSEKDLVQDAVRESGRLPDMGRFHSATVRESSAQEQSAHSGL